MKKKDIIKVPLARKGERWMLCYPCFSDLITVCDKNGELSNEHNAVATLGMAVRLGVDCDDQFRLKKDHYYRCNIVSGGQLFSKEMLFRETEPHVLQWVNPSNMLTLSPEEDITVIKASDHEPLPGLPHKDGYVVDHFIRKYQKRPVSGRYIAVTNNSENTNKVLTFRNRQPDDGFFHYRRLYDLHPDSPVIWLEEGKYYICYSGGSQVTLLWHNDYFRATLEESKGSIVHLDGDGDYVLYEATAQGRKDYIRKEEENHKKAAEGPSAEDNLTDLWRTDKLPEGEYLCRMTVLRPNQKTCYGGLMDDTGAGPRMVLHHHEQKFFQDAGHKEWIPDEYIAAVVRFERTVRKVEQSVVKPEASPAQPAKPAPVPSTLADSLAAVAAALPTDTLLAEIERRCK